MTIMLAVPKISNAFLDAEAIVSPDFSFVVTQWRLHYFFEMRETPTLMSINNMPEVKSLVFDVAETTSPIWG